jgi:DNA-directed RNA polymerase specialized sigma subunit
MPKVPRSDRILPRLQGAALKASNEKMFQDFQYLVKYVVQRKARQFHLTHEQTEDLSQSTLLELFQAPACYRNYKGISLILKHKMRDILRKSLRCEAEMPVGLMRAEKTECTEFPEPISGPCDLAHVEVGLVTRQISSLTSSERAVISLVYGLEGNKDICEFHISKKLGRHQSWVKRKHASGIKRMQRALGISQSSPSPSL